MDYVKNALISNSRPMPQFEDRPPPNTQRTCAQCPAGPWIVLWLLCHVALVLARTEAASLRERKVGEGIVYFNDVVRDVPWSIQVVKIERAQTNLQLTPTLGRATAQGLSTLSAQLRGLPRTLGVPVAAVNGDFYQTEGGVGAGDPRGLEIFLGELISGPKGSASFWLDSTNQPRMAATVSRFKVSWPGGESLPFGLNEERSSSEVVLYTSRFGASTRTRGGREFVLENSSAGPSLPLQIGQTYSLRIRDVRDTGNTRITSDVVVLSLGPGVADRVPKPEVGSMLEISTATVPNLKGAAMALSGGPILVQTGKVLRVTSNKAGDRHPRTAFGWNETHLFLVQVDGRQPDLSIGMTLRELADYMVRLGCQQAMNLDGGGSSTLWLNGRVMNSPCYGHERPIGNCLALVRKGPDATGP
ncbi:MAG: phosphodiester glycosidase family protein, partial [Verrucomicrobiales bacterium]|nr:phosphodiester glycosidase family protein [Verrucomicrobiales bacterium]